MTCNILKNKTINDKEFLETMIVHHNVAVDMSKMITKLSTNDTILAFARNIIFNQTREIYFMKTLYIESKYLINEKNTTNTPLINTFKSEYPSVFQNLKCDESHFNSHFNLIDKINIL